MKMRGVVKNLLASVTCTAMTLTSVVLVGAGPPAVASGVFSTLAPGAALPSDGTCADLVRPTDEQRSDNTVANHSVPAPGSFRLARLGRQNGYDDRTQLLEDRVTGDFTGTTDEIIQWASCKWGINENIVRAIAVAESGWHQSRVGDLTWQPALCPPGYTVPCPRSFGIHQVTWNSDPIGTFPSSRSSTAFNLDASLLVHRICYEGYMLWLRDIGYTTYRAGDLWGCEGQWYSGNWHDAGAETYIATVHSLLVTRPWSLPLF
jgi:hypothetical protein